MADIDSALMEIREMETLSSGRSPVHSLNPLAKFITTIVYIFTVMSFDKSNMTGLVFFALYPVIMLRVSGISIGECIYRLRVAIPFVLLIGLTNPFFDRKPLFYIGIISITSGMVSMTTLFLKGMFCLMATFVLVATTGIDKICRALRMIHVPKIIVTLIHMIYRYITVMMEEISVMSMSYHLRAPSHKGIHYSAWGSFLGQLLLRSMDKAEELYSSMCLRGFMGDFRHAKIKKADVRDYCFVLATVMLFIVCRVINVTLLIGNVFV